MAGVGRMPRPSVSLYRLTLPLTTGKSSARQAAAMPRMLAANWPMISGFSGLPKFMLSVIASGRAPTADRLRQASATACIPPVSGSAAQ